MLLKWDTVNTTDVLTFCSRMWGLNFIAQNWHKVKLKRKNYRRRSVTNFFPLRYQGAAFVENEFASASVTSQLVVIPWRRISRLTRISCIVETLTRQRRCFGSNFTFRVPFVNRARWWCRILYFWAENTHSRLICGDEKLTYRYVIDRIDKVLTKIVDLSHIVRMQIRHIRVEW